MKYLVVAILSIGLLVGGLPVLAPAEASTAYTGRMGFGMDAASMNAQTNVGAKPDYGVIWVGPWTLQTGWGGPNAEMTAMRQAGVTPVIHYYYWGDDISRSCYQHGCWSSLHGVQKNQQGWQRLADELVQNLNARMGGAAVVIVLETEFNKGDMQTYKTFDHALAAKADFFNQKYSNAKLVLGLGNWNRGAWSTWTASAAKSDYIGVQAMAGSTRDTLTTYRGLFEETRAGARDAQSLFRKPVFITDIALSSYPSSTYEKYQAESLAKFFTGMADLKRAGVEAMLYRTWLDQAWKNTDNYYGQAERHWGVAKSTGTWKSAASVWVDGVRAERAVTASSLNAKFTPSSSVNEWWVDVRVDANKVLARVDVRANGGSWTLLEATSWGTWAKSMHIPKGSQVEFRATAMDGTRATSPSHTWLGGTSTGSSSSYSATFRPASSVNEWWVDVAVTARPDPTRVDVRANGGSWVRLDATSWGTWAKSLNIPTGASVQFRAHDGAGNTAISETITWLRSGPAFAAKFAPASSAGTWWVEVYVDGNKAIQRVDARVDGGSWTRLDATNWGSWAKSMHAARGATVEFRATSNDGERVTSERFTWLGPAFSASFSPRSQSNAWWVEVQVTGSERVTRVDACVRGASCTSLPASDWGTWARSMNAAGTEIQFKATGSSGGTVTSSWYKWG